MRKSNYAVWRWAVGIAAFGTISTFCFMAHPLLGILVVLVAGEHLWSYQHGAPDPPSVAAAQWAGLVTVWVIIVTYLLMGDEAYREAGALTWSLTGVAVALMLSAMFGRALMLRRLDDGDAGGRTAGDEFLSVNRGRN